MKQATPEMATVRAILAATVLLAILSAVLGPGAMAESTGIPELYEGLVILDDPAYFIFRTRKKQRRRKRKARSPAHRRHLRSRLWNLPRNPPRRPQATHRGTYASSHHGTHGNTFHGAGNHGGAGSVAHGGADPCAGACLHHCHHPAHGLAKHRFRSGAHRDYRRARHRLGQRPRKHRQRR